MGRIGTPKHKLLCGAGYSIFVRQ